MNLNIKCRCSLDLDLFNIIPHACIWYQLWQYQNSFCTVCSSPTYWRICCCILSAKWHCLGWLYFYSWRSVSLSFDICAVMWHFVYVHLCPPSPFETGGYLLSGQERTIKNLATDRWMDCLPSSVPQSNVAKRGLLRLERGDLVVKHCPKPLLIPIPLKLLCAHSEWGLEKWRTDRNAWGNSLGLSFESISDWDCHHILLFHKSRSVWLWNHLMGHLKERIPSSFYHPLQVSYCTKREFKKV